MMEVAEEGNLILNHTQVMQKIKRIAYEIYENNFKEKQIVMAGIDGQGFVLAQSLAAELESISSLKTNIVKITLDKIIPSYSEVKLNVEPKALKKKCVVLVDDVLNSGRTLAYGMKPLLESEAKKVEVAVLVNRSHTMFPIQPTYTGYELTTTLSDHVEVVLGKKSSVYLK